MVVMLYFIFLFISIVANEAIVELISKSVFFSPLREYLFKSNNKILSFFGKVVSCPYCCSVWTAYFFAFIVFVFTKAYFSSYVGIIFFVLLVHKGSNILHDISDRYFVKPAGGDLNE